MQGRLKVLKRLRCWLSQRHWVVRFGVKGGLAAALLLSPGVIYFLLGWALGCIPVNRTFSQPVTGVEVFVWSNGVHTDLVVPASRPEMDWRIWFSPDDFARSPTPSYVALGWGDRDFFLNVPEWKDLTFKVALDALVLKGETAMHVTLLDQPPAPGPSRRRIVMTADQYQTLTAYLTNSFRLNQAHRPVRIVASGYGSSDAFYEATGHYGPIHTCNEWTGAGLRKAGVRTGIWTPFEPLVMRHLPE